MFDGAWLFVGHHGNSTTSIVEAESKYSLELTVFIWGLLNHGVQDPSKAMWVWTFCNTYGAPRWYEKAAVGGFEIPFRTIDPLDFERNHDSIMESI